MGIEVKLAEQRAAKVPRWIGPRDEEPDQERPEIDPSKIGSYETPEYL